MIIRRYLSTQIASTTAVLVLLLVLQIALFVLAGLRQGMLPAML